MQTHGARGIDYCSGRSVAAERAYIDGDWCDANDGATFEVINPQTRYLSLGGIAE